jgi:hypothetical protein
MGEGLPQPQRLVNAASAKENGGPGDRRFEMFDTDF